MTTPLSSFRDAVYRYLAGFCTCRPDRVVTCFSISCGGTLSGGDGTGMTSTGVSSGFHSSSLQGDDKSYKSDVSFEKVGNGPCDCRISC